MKIKLAIADDHPMVVRGLTDIVRPCPHIEVVATYGTGKDLLHGLSLQLPDVLLLDIQLPDLQGDELARTITKQYPSVRILVVSSIDIAYRVKDMMQLGCAGYLLKSTAPETLVEAIEKVYQGTEFLEPNLKDELLASVFHPEKRSRKHIRLTKREQEILVLICEGLNNYDIGDRLFLSHRTVENHRMSLHQKFDVKNSAALVRAALQQGFIK